MPEQISFQVGLDIATAISVISAALMFMRSVAKKESLRIEKYAEERKQDLKNDFKRQVHLICESIKNDIDNVISQFYAARSHVHNNNRNEFMRSSAKLKELLLKMELSGNTTTLSFIPLCSLYDKSEFIEDLENNFNQNLKPAYRALNQQLSGYLNIYRDKEFDDEAKQLFDSFMGASVLYRHKDYSGENNSLMSASARYFHQIGRSLEREFN